MGRRKSTVSDLTLRTLLNRKSDPRAGKQRGAQSGTDEGFALPDNRTPSAHRSHRRQSFPHRLQQLLHGELHGCSARTGKKGQQGVTRRTVNPTYLLVPGPFGGPVLCCQAIQPRSLKRKPEYAAVSFLRWQSHQTLVLSRP